VLIVNANPGGFQITSGVRYFIGNFDGNTFTADDPSRMDDFLDYGPDFYAITSFFQPNFTNVPRLPAIAWMSNWVYTQNKPLEDYPPTSPWRGQMSIPRDYSLFQYKGRLYVRALPDYQRAVAPLIT
jgi:fructan beta-fructosidase